MSRSRRQENTIMVPMVRISRALPLRTLSRRSTYVLLCIGLIAIGAPVDAQVLPGAGGDGDGRNALATPVATGQGAGFVGGPDASANGQPGGAANADFDSLIDLIVSTVSTETWAENGGGEAEIRPFPTGVIVDAAGTLRLKAQSRPAEGARGLSAVRGEAPPHTSRNRASQDARKESKLRYVSLPRLEREIERRQRAKQPLDASMLTLAGLRRVRYVFVYPASGDVVLAGPAGDWRVNPEGRIVATESGLAVARLDDLIVLLRRGGGAADSHFGCAINPRQEALAKTQAYLGATRKTPLQPGQRQKWLGELRDTVGVQDIQVWGIDPASRVAGVLVAADYHMKLIGMGLADGVAGVKSYLASIRAGAGESPPPMSVLRWWFALEYDAIRKSASNDAFEFVGQGVRVLSENEILGAQGRRVHTNRSDPLNRQFADAFTANFSALATKYPVYSELRNIFDLAMAVAIVRSERLDERAAWTPGIFTDVERLGLPKHPVPRQVETVINHRLINRRHIVAGVSGGVLVAPSDVLGRVRGASEDGELTRVRREAPAKLAAQAWWWDGTN
jgi:hypothetical protein